MTRTLVATLVFTTFAFQMLVAESVACATTVGVGEGQTLAMPGMDMSGSDMANPAASHHASQGTETHHPPCDQPTVPTSCQLMAPCAVSFIGVAVADDGTESQVSARVMPTRALEPASRTDPPEFPPPRA